MNRLSISPKTSQAQLILSIPEKLVEKYLFVILCKLFIFLKKKVFQIWIKTFFCRKFETKILFLIFPGNLKPYLYFYERPFAGPD